MLTFLPKRVRGVAASVLVICNTLIWCLPLYLFALLRFVGPTQAGPWCTRRVMNVAEMWIDCNNLLLGLFTRLVIDLREPAGLSPKKWYLVLCNHQTWADIVILQRVFNRKIPVQKFFIKQQLLYVPVIGIAWWALDFPVMRRYSKEFLARHPELKGKDLEATRRSCEKFKLTPVGILNFLEGTRFTAAKHRDQASPYRHLLRPKSGGAALVISSLGDKLDCILDVTIHYPDGVPGFFDFLCGVTERVTVIVEQREVPVDTILGHTPVTIRKDFRNWVDQVWEDKDQKLAQLEASP